jgi:zinc/manganese transport system permease protein
MLAAGLAGFISRFTSLKEDASLAAIYLVALALGVTLLSRQGTQLDLLHILFGSALGVDAPGLLLVASVASVSVITLAALYRGLVLESFDPVFLAAVAGRGWGRRGWIWQQAFLMLVVVNLVAGFQTLGTLMAVGLMMLPAVSARLWHDSLSAQLVSGPTIIGCAGVLYGVSLLVSPGGWLPQVLKRPHRVG